MKETNNSQDTTYLFRTNSRIAGTYIPAILSFFILVVIDQVTKYLVDHNMELNSSIPVVKDIFEIHYIRNPGAAWGILANRQMWFYICTTFFLIIGWRCYIRCVKCNRFRAFRILLVFILSGAMGNLIDRLRFRYVIDFLYFKLIDFPVFNIADCYVTVGCFLLILVCLFRYKETEMDALFSILLH